MVTRQVTSIRSGANLGSRLVRRGSARVPNRGPSTDVVIEVQGLDTLTEHFAAIAQVTGPLAYHMVDFFGQNIKENARRFVPVDSGATLQSIHAGDAGGGGPEGGPTPDGKPVAMGDGWSIEVGPTTYYARWLEFGTVKMSPRPFMIPAISIVEPAFISAMHDLAGLADQFNTLGQAGQDQQVGNLLGQVRGLLYTSAKAAGDVNAFFGRDITGGTRSGLYTMAQLLGDVNSISKGAVGARVSRRLSGRVTGRLAGVGSASIFGSATYSGSPGGDAGLRIYNRVAGRALSTGVFSGSRGGSQVGLTRFGRLP